MSRNRSSLLNKACGLLKLVEEDKVEFIIDYNTIKIVIPDRNALGWIKGETAIKYFIEHKITWRLSFENNNLIYQIQL